MYKAIVFVVFGTGAPRHRHYSGRGVAFNRSPKRALNLARAKAQANIQDGSLVLYRAELYRNGRLIGDWD